MDCDILQYRRDSSANGYFEGCIASWSVKDNFSFTESLRAEIRLDQCTGCLAKLLTGRAVELDDYRWHENCFNCSYCFMRIGEDKEVRLLVTGKLLCGSCAECSICKLPLTQDDIWTGKMLICNACSICCTCQRSIYTLDFPRPRKRGNEIYCKDCYTSVGKHKLMELQPANENWINELDNPEDDGPTWLEDGMNMTEARERLPSAKQMKPRPVKKRPSVWKRIFRRNKTGDSWFDDLSESGMDFQSDSSSEFSSTKTYLT